MSGVNFNDTDKQAGAEGSALTNFAGSRHIAAQAWTVSSNDSTTNSAYEDINGIANINFTAPDARDYLFMFFGQNFSCSGAVASVRFSVLIDDSITLEFPVCTMNATSSRTNASGVAIQNLSAGPHTMRVQWKRYNGSGTVNFDITVPCEVQVVVM